MSEYSKRLWAVREFRIVFVGLAASMFGDALLLLVLGIWVKSLTGSSAQAGLTFLLLGSPSLGSPLGGYAIDRVPRRPFLVWVNVASALLLLPLLAVRDSRDVPIIYAVAFGYGVSLVLNGAALNGLLKALLPEELLGDANGSLQTVQQGLRLVAPLLGAGLFATFGGPVVAAVDAVTFLLAAGALTMISLQEAAPAPAEERWWGEMTAGMWHLVTARQLRSATLAIAAMFLVIGMAESVVYAVTDLALHRPPSFIGVLVCAQGVGGVTGGVLAARIVRRLGESRTLALGLLLMATGLLGLVSSSLTVVLVGNLVFGLGSPLVAVAFSTLLQRETPAYLMGRVSAAVDVLIGGPQILSTGAGAALIAVVDYRVLVIVMVVVTAAAGLALLRARPSTVETGPTGTSEQPLENM